MNKRYVMIFTAICGSIFSLLADMPRDYYPNSLEGKNGAELKTELHNLLKNHTRHRKALGGVNRRNRRI